MYLQQHCMHCSPCHDKLLLVFQEQLTAVSQLEMTTENVPLLIRNNNDASAKASMFTQSVVAMLAVQTHTLADRHVTQTHTHAHMLARMLTHSLSGSLTHSLSLKQTDRHRYRQNNTDKIPSMVFYLMMLGLL